MNLRSAAICMALVWVVAGGLMAADGTGLVGTYYDQADFRGVGTARTDAVVDFDWSGGSPMAGIAADTFTVRWTGMVEAPSSEAITFTTLSDDGVRLWVDGRLLIDHWSDHGAVEDSGTITLVAGQRYAIRLDFYENGGAAVMKLRWSSPTMTKRIVPQARLYPSVPPGNGTGLRAQYFDERNLSGPAVQRLDAAVDFDWGAGSPMSGIGPDTFSARWSGEVQPRFSETYTFRTNSDDGVRLWVGGRLLIDQWNDHASRVDQAAMTLQAGQRYPLVLEYYENRGAAVAKLAWSSPSTPPAIIPATQLYPAPAIGTGTGLMAAYFDNRDFSGPTQTRVDATVDFDWAGGVPVTGIGADTFAVRWTGEVQALYSELVTFQTLSDDGIRVWVDQQLIIDHWNDHGAAIDNGAIELIAGRRYPLTVEFYENGGAAVAKLRWMSASQPLQIVPRSQLYPALPVGSGNGLTATYFDQRDFTAPMVTRTDPVIAFDWGAGSPDPSLGADTFSVRWSGDIQPFVSETYTFTTISDDGIRVWIGNQLVVDHWNDHAASARSGTIALTGGTRYPLRVEYYENGGAAQAKLMWSSPSTPFMVVPASQLFAASPPVLTVATPVLTPAGGTFATDVPVSLTTATPGAEIRYTLDGTVPNASSPLAVTPITIDRTVTLSARGFLGGWNPSPTAIATFTLVATSPTITPPGGQFTSEQEVTLSAPTADSELRYTLDGSVPTSASLLYAGPFTVTAAATVTARTFRAGWTSSPVATAVFSFSTTAPAITPAGGTFAAAQHVVLSSPTPGADVRYTLDGSDPDLTSALVGGPLEIDQNLTLTARAFRIGWTPSNPVTAVFSFVPSAPTITPAGGSFSDTISVTLASATAGAEVRYTLDGSEPSLASPVAVGAVAVEQSATLIARTFKPGWSASNRVSAEFFIQVAAPVMDPPAGSYDHALAVTLTSATSAATIHFTLDGTDPTPASPVFTQPIPVSATTTVRAIALRAGCTTSGITEAIYAINAPPTISVAATAALDVAGTAAVVRVRGDDDGGEPALTYVWTASGPAPVVFSDGGTNTARECNAAFTVNGTYVLTAMVTDAAGLTVHSAVELIVPVRPTVLTVMPDVATISAGETIAVLADVRDQFGEAIAPPVGENWTITGAGTLVANGLIAQVTGATAGGVATVTVQVGGLSAQALITVTVPVSGPVVTITATTPVTIEHPSLAPSYVLSTSDQAGGPAYQWIDITGGDAAYPTGTLVTGLSDDNNIGPVALGFSFPFYDQSFSQIRVCSNGWLSFTDTSNVLSGGVLPNASMPKNLIAFYWRDLLPSNGGSVYASQIDADRFVLLAQNIPWYGDASKRVTAEVVLHRSGRIELAYAQAPVGQSAYAVGIQNQDGSAGTSFSVNQNSVHAGLLVRFDRQVPVTNPAVLTVQRSGTSEAPLEVAYTMAGSATSGADYQALSGIVNIPAGAQSAVILIDALDDLLKEAEETVVVTLSPAGYYQVGVPGAATAIIQSPVRPVLAFAQPSSSVSETTATFGIAVALDRPADATVRVHYQVVGGNAVSGADFTLAAGDLVFAAGETARFIAVNVLSDFAIELDETVMVGLSQPIGADLGAQTLHTVTIRDVSPANVHVELLAPSIHENDAAGTAVRFIRTGSTEAPLPLTVYWSGTAVAGVDFVGTLPGSVVIPAGESLIDVPVVPRDDALIDSDRYLYVQLAAVPGYLMGVSFAQLWLLDDETPMVRAFFSEEDAYEGDVIYAYVHLVDADNQLVTRQDDVVLPYQISGVDTLDISTPLTGTLTIVAHSSYEYATALPIALIEDGVEDGPEELSLSATLGLSSGQATVTVADRARISVVALASTVAENSGSSATLRFTRTGVSGSETAVQLSWYASQAAAGVDFAELLPNTLIFPIGQATVDLAITPIEDAIIESDELVQVNIDYSLTYTVQQGVAAIRILDDEVPLLALAITPSHLLEGATVTATLSLNDTAGQPITRALAIPVAYQITGISDADIVPALSGSVIVPANGSSASLSIATIADGVAEAAETLVMNASLATSVIQASAVIHDVPEVGITIFAPADGAVVTVNPVAISVGVVAPTGETLEEVRINSVLMQLRPVSPFVGTLALDLAEGLQVISAEARTTAGTVFQANVVVTVAARPLSITILSPADGAVFAGELVFVQAQIPSPTATVTINGMPTVINGFIASAWVHLVSGANTITATISEDGRSGSDSVALNFQPPPDYDPTQDSDGDGIPDGQDYFPQDPQDHQDTDVDGVADNQDAAPNDPATTSALTLTAPAPGLTITSHY